MSEHVSPNAEPQKATSNGSAAEGQSAAGSGLDKPSDDGGPPPDANLVEFENAISEFIRSCNEAGSALPEALSAFMMKLSFYVCSLNAKLSTVTGSFDTLAAQVSAMSDSVGGRLDTLDAKVHLALEKLGVRKDLIAKAGQKAAQKSSSAEGSSSAKMGPPSALPAKANPNESSPSVVYFIQSTSTTEVLNPLFPFELKIGSLRFNCQEQAFQYIRCMVHENFEKAAKMKAATTPQEVASLAAGFNTLAKEEWQKVAPSVLLALFHRKAAQCEPFAGKLKELPAGKQFALVSSDKTWGTAMSRAYSMKSAPKYTGANQYGQTLAEFFEKFRANGVVGAVGGEGGEKGATAGTESEKDAKKDGDAEAGKAELFDLDQYCHPDLGVDVGKQILVMGDIQLDGFTGEFNTKLVQVRTLQAVNAKTKSNTVKAQLEALGGDLSDYGAFILVFGTYEVGRSPEDVEKDYIELFEHVTKIFPGPIYVSNALPRTDKFQDSLKLANYAISIAARKFEERIQLLDIHERFIKLPMWKNLLRVNGFQLSEGGAKRLAEFLADLVPFANLLCPREKPASGGSSPAGAKSHRESPSGGPPRKRGRGGGPSPTRGSPRGGFMSGGARAIGSYQNSMGGGAGSFIGGSMGRPSPWGASPAGNGPFWNQPAPSGYGALQGGQRFDY